MLFLTESWEAKRTLYTELCSNFDKRVLLPDIGNGEIMHRSGY